MVSSYGRVTGAPDKNKTIHNGSSTLSEWANKWHRCRLQVCASASLDYPRAANSFLPPFFTSGRRIMARLSGIFWRRQPSGALMLSILLFSQCFHFVPVASGKVTLRDASAHIVTQWSTKGAVCPKITRERKNRIEMVRIKVKSIGTEAYQSS